MTTEAPQPATSESSRHIIVTVHGIRTIGHWQRSLAEMVPRMHFDRKGTPPTIWTFSYGWFSAAALCVPWLRSLVIRRFENWLENVWKLNRNARLDIAAHSFGTFVVAGALERLMRRTSLRVETLLLCGSILPSTYRWDRHVPSRIRRVVNDCGTRDWIVALCQLVVVGGGSAGLIGFVAMNSSNGLGVFNRFFDYGHSGYFSEATREQFMERYWAPLLGDLPHVVGHDVRSGTSASGALYWLLNNSTLLKLGLYSALLAGVILIVQIPAARERALRTANLQIDAASALLAVGSDAEALDIMSEMTFATQRLPAADLLVKVAAKRLGESWRRPSLARFGVSLNGAFMVGFARRGDSDLRLERWNLVNGEQSALSNGCQVNDPWRARVEAVSGDGNAIVLEDDSRVLCADGHRQPLEADDRIGFAAERDVFLRWSQRGAHISSFEEPTKARWSLPDSGTIVDHAEISPSGRYVAVEMRAEVSVFDTATGLLESLTQKSGDVWWLWEPPVGPATVAIGAVHAVPGCQLTLNDGSCALPEPSSGCDGTLEKWSPARRSATAVLEIRDKNDARTVCVLHEGKLDKLTTLPERSYAEESPIAISDDGSSVALIHGSEVIAYSTVTMAALRTWQHPLPALVLFSPDGNALVVAHEACEDGTCDDFSLPTFTARYGMGTIGRYPKPEECGGNTALARYGEQDRLVIGECATLIGDAHLAWTSTTSASPFGECDVSEPESDGTGAFTTTLICTPRLQHQRPYVVKGLIVATDVSPDGTMLALQTNYGGGGSPSYASARLYVISARQEMREWELDIPGTFSGFSHQVFFGPEARSVISYGMSIAGSGGGAGASLELCSLIGTRRSSFDDCKVRYTRSIRDDAGPVVLSPSREMAIVEVDDRWRGNGARLVEIDLHTGLDLRMLQSTESRLLAGSFSHDGALVVGLIESGAAVVWDVSTGKRLLEVRLLNEEAAARADELVRCAATPNGISACEGYVPPPFIAISDERTRIVGVVDTSVYVVEVGTTLNSDTPLVQLLESSRATSVDYDYGRNQLGQ